MTITTAPQPGQGAAQAAILSEMSRQRADAGASLAAAAPRAMELATAIRRRGSLVLLGMGGSHAVGRAVEPLYRGLGIDTVALPLSEQLGQPLPLLDKVAIVTSQSGESAEVLRWFAEAYPPADTFGMTMEAGSSLARLAPSLVGVGGSELAFAATRSLTVTLALHAAVLGALGLDLTPLQSLLARPEAQPDTSPARRALAGVGSVVTSGRSLQGLAEAIALGLTELSRLPCFSLEGGQLRHGPMEMLGPHIGVVMFRDAGPTGDLVAGLAAAAVETGAPVVVFDASGQAQIAGAVTLSFPAATGLPALFTLLPAAQAFMVDFAAARVRDVGQPLRSTKVTRIE